MQTNNQPMLTSTGIVLLNYGQVTDPRPAFAEKAYSMTDYFDDRCIMPSDILDIVWGYRKFNTSEINYSIAICNLYFTAAYYQLTEEVTNRAKKFLLYVLNTKDFAEQTGCFVISELLDAVTEHPDYSYAGIRSIMTERLAA